MSEESRESTNKSLQRETVGGFLWLLSGSGSQAVIRIIVFSILARLITPYEFGIIGAALIVIGFSRMLSQMGVGPALVQRTDINTEHIRTSYTSSLLLGIFIATILISSSSLISAFFKMKELKTVLDVIALIFVIDSFSIVSQSLLQREMSFKMISIVNASTYLLGYGCIGVGFAYFDFGVWALVYAHLAQALLKAIFFSYLKPHSIIPFWDFNSFTELIRFGGGFTVARLANYCALQGDNIITGKLLGAEALGLYSRAYQLMGTPSNLIGQSLNDALFPAMSSVKENKAKLKRVYLKTVELVGLIAIPGSLIIIINAKEIVLILLGTDWVEVIPIIQILGASILFRMGYKISDSLIKSIGAVNKGAVLQIIYALAILSGASIGQIWGLSGLAIGVSIAIALNYLFMALLSLKKLKIRFTEFLKCHLAGIVAAAVVYFISYTGLFILRENLDNIFIIEIAFLSIVITLYLSVIFLLRNKLRVNKEINKLLRFLG